jgi:hypothetical protein
MGDWGGARRTLADKGFDLVIRLTQSYQGVTTGARGNQGGGQRGATRGRYFNFGSSGKRVGNFASGSTSGTFVRCC